MEYLGIDVHSNESQICMLTVQGEILEQRIRTRPERFAEVLGDRPQARIVIEASTESEWVAPAPVRTRARSISLIRALLRHEGWRVLDRLRWIA